MNYYRLFILSVLLFSSHFSRVEANCAATLTRLFQNHSPKVYTKDEKTLLVFTAAEFLHDGIEKERKLRHLSQELTSDLGISTIGQNLVTPPRGLLSKLKNRVRKNFISISSALWIASVFGFNHWTTSDLPPVFQAQFDNANQIFQTISPYWLLATIGVAFFSPIFTRKKIDDTDGNKDPHEVDPDFDDPEERPTEVETPLNNVPSEIPVQMFNPYTSKKLMRDRLITLIRRMRSNSANLVGAPLSIYMAFQFENYLARPNDILGDIDFTDKKYLPYWITYTALFIGIPWTSYEFLPMSEWTLAMDERHREERIENLYGFLETLTKKVNIVIVDDIDLDELQDSLRMNEWIAN